MVVSNHAQNKDTSNESVQCDQGLEICDIEIDNDERGVIGDFTTVSNIRITKAKPE